VVAALFCFGLAFLQSLVCIRCSVRRSVQIDARNGDRLGSGGYN
jgi:hypothetical protein